MIGRNGVVCGLSALGAGFPQADVEVMLDVRQTDREQVCLTGHFRAPPDTVRGATHP